MIKRLSSILAITLLLLNLSACGAREPAATTEPAVSGVATEADISALENLYKGKNAYYGDYHDHADTGGNSDGKMDLSSWKVNMTTKMIDFAAIVDHKQSIHMGLPEWDDTIFIGGSEAATWLTDLDYQQLHYNMIFATVEEFEAFIAEHDDTFMYSQGLFFPTYAKYSSGELMKIAEDVRKHGGFFTHVHPKGKSYLQSDNALDYWFGNETGLEVLCGYYGNMSAEENQKALQVWLELLYMGKRVWATAGSDSHNASATHSLTTIYSEEKSAKSYISYFREGNFTAGPAGIRMCIGDTATGGVCNFDGNRIVVAVGDIHPQEFYSSNQYRLDLLNERGVVESYEFTGSELSGQEYIYLATDTEDCMYYRAELYDVSQDYLFAVGNPIWNIKYTES